MLGARDHAVEGQPAHDLGMHEVAGLAAHLPQAAVGLAPERGELAGDGALQRPDLVHVGQTRLARSMEGGDHRTVHVELALHVRAVAHAHRSAVVEAGEPVELELVEHALAVQAIHDLQVFGRTAHRAHQPPAPLARLLEVARADQRIERERRVAQPAETVVPVARAAGLLGQRGGGRRHDATGGRIGQGLEREQRALHRLAVLAAVAAMRAPGAPAARRVLEQRVGVARDRRPLVRGEPLQREGHRLPRGDRELGAAGKVLVDQRHAGRDAHRIGAGYGVDRAVDPLHPWHPFAVVEADAQFGAQVHGAPHAAHDAHHLVRAVA